MTEKDSFTYLEVEAALCIWEWINDATLTEGPHTDRRWIAFRGNYGSPELRSASALIYAPWLLQVYDLCTSVDEDMFDCMSYDWEVVPMIMALCLNDDEPTLEASKLPDPRTVAEVVLADVAKKHWYDDARAAAKFHWCYSDLVSDHPDSFEIARQYGEMPEATVIEIGEKYDLVTPDPITQHDRPPMVLSYRPEKYRLPPTNEAAA